MPSGPRYDESSDGNTPAGEENVMIGDFSLGKRRFNLISFVYVVASEQVNYNKLCFRRGRFWNCKRYNFLQFHRVSCRNRSS